MPTTAEPIFDGAEKKMSPSNEAVKINYIGDSGARVRLLAVRSTARGEEGEKRHQKHNQIRGDQRLGQILRREIGGDDTAWCQVKRFDLESIHPGSTNCLGVKVILVVADMG